MANQDSAFGLRAIGKIGQNRDAQGLSEYSIAASATAIYQGDPVQALATGTIGVANSSANVLLGSLNGVFYTDPSNKPVWANHLAAANAATDIVGFVSDDPYERFEIQSNNTGASTQTDVFMNYDIAYAAGGSPNFVSKVELDYATGVSTTNQLRVIGVSKDPSNNELASANTNYVVEIVEHFYKQAAGI